MLYRFAEATGRDVTARVDLNKFSDAAKVVGWAEEAWPGPWLRVC